MIDQFPHCDSRVLHAPGECEFCDHHPEWQDLRKAWGIAFTGHPVDTAYGTGREGAVLPCPADFTRPPGSPSDHRRWGGNKPAIAAYGPPRPEQSYASLVLYG